MDTAVVEQFLTFFQDFINLCQTENWPDNYTTEMELENAFVISQHVEKCLNKLQKKGIINEFLSVLINDEISSNSALKNCLSDPPKYIIKKIINSNTSINQMDLGFKLFLQLFSEDKLENCLTDLMLEAASKDTLLCNLTTELTDDRIMKFKSNVLMSELSNCNSNIVDLLSNCNENTVELLVVSLLNNEPKFTAYVKLIADSFLSVVISKDNIYKNFWRYLFKVDEKYFNAMCLENSDIFMYIVEALCDCGKLLREGLSAESFYIDLNASELANIVKRICKNDCLKTQFYDFAASYDINLDFWHNLMKV